MPNVFALLIILITLFWPAPGYGQVYFDFDQAVYHTCYDGDTCMMSLPGIHPLFGDHIPVRLAGIDTPEMKGQCERGEAIGSTGERPCPFGSEWSRSDLTAQSEPGQVFQD